MCVNPTTGAWSTLDDMWIRPGPSHICGCDDEVGTGAFIRPRGAIDAGGDDVEGPILIASAKTTSHPSRSKQRRALNKNQVADGWSLDPIIRFHIDEIHRAVDLPENRIYQRDPKWRECDLSNGHDFISFGVIYKTVIKKTLG